MVGSESSASEALEEPRELTLYRPSSSHRLGVRRFPGQGGGLLLQREVLL